METFESQVPNFEMQINIIQSCTDLSPEQWIHIYAAKFRDIIENHPEYSEFQVKYALYFPNK